MDRINHNEKEQPHMTNKRPNAEEMNDLINSNPIRDRIRSRTIADFSSATLRRIALMYQGRERE
jgi:hypothetical protein